MFKLLFAIFALSLPALASGGETKFWVWDLRVMPPAFRQPDFELMLSKPLRDGKDTVNFWVEKNLGAYTPTSTTLAALASLLVESTPLKSIAPSLGIIDLQRLYFGAQPIPPSGDRNFNVVIAAIPPYEKNGRKFGFDGFFNVFDQFTEAQAREDGQHSNEKNILYVNALQDLNTDYMHAVVAHELNHLLTFTQRDERKTPLAPWLNEMLGEAAMQMTGYFTDTHHVNTYRAHPEWPLAVEGYGITYGGLSLFAEFLMNKFGHANLEKIVRADHAKTSFARLEVAYGLSWPELFSQYLHWLYEQSPPSAFAGQPVVAHEPTRQMAVAPTGVLFLTAPIDKQKLLITAVPKGCEQSQNMLRTSEVERNGTKATALWIESTPPCESIRGGTGFEKDSFKLEDKNE